MRWPPTRSSEHHAPLAGEEVERKWVARKDGPSAGNTPGLLRITLAAAEVIMGEGDRRKEGRLKQIAGLDRDGQGTRGLQNVANEPAAASTPAYRPEK